MIARTAQAALAAAIWLAITSLVVLAAGRAAASPAPAERAAASPATGRDPESPTGGTIELQGGKLDPALAAQLLAEPQQPISIIVHVRLPHPAAAGAAAGAAAAPMAPGARQSAYLAALRQHHQTAAAQLQADLAVAARAGSVQRLESLWLAGALALTATPDVVRQLAGRPDVRWVSLDGTATVDVTRAGPIVTEGGPGSSAEAPLWNILRVGADRVWHQLGYDGSGVTVAIIDSGVDYHHEDLMTRYHGYVAASPLRPLNSGRWWCPDVQCGVGAAYPTDAIGHGTHVAGTILAGQGVGVAPGARWVAALVCPNPVECVDSWIVEAMQWLVDPARPAEAQPSIMNGSFATNSGDDLVFKSAVDNLVASGVVVVAAAGNNPGLVGAPASYPAAIGVGAMTDDGQVWRNSGRGRSLGSDVKPDLVAPGVGITSTVPGGGWSRLTGTSMASPHVAGVTALLRQAQPDLTPEEVKAVLRRTAWPLRADQVPEPASGWGMVNAFAAVASVTDVGHLRGHVTRDADGAPIPWARVRVAELNGDPLMATEVDPDDGSYEVSMRPGSYLVTAEAFTFRGQVVRGVEIHTGQETELDFSLAPDEPMGTFSGLTVDASGGAQIAADIRLLGVPERFVIRANEFTGFSARLPAGTYALRVERFGYRVYTDTVKIVAGATSTRTYPLQPAPRILLVDGDGWAYRGGAEYYADSLARLGYLHHTRRVTDETVGSSHGEGPPTADELGAYDLVIWASPFSSPGFVRGATELSRYLTDGGRLLLSGQDALCHDAGTDVALDPCNRGAVRQPYVQNQLYLRVVRDNAPSRTVVGTADGPLAGLSFHLNGPGSMDDQSTPDELAVVDPLHARLVADYEGGGGAGVLVDTCVAHRAVALGFGFEGIAGADSRDAVLRQLIAALTAPTPERRLLAQPDAARRISPPGTPADFVVTLHNTGAAAEPFEIDIVSSDWPASLWQAGFTAPLSGTIRLGPCEQVSFGVRVLVPSNARRGATAEVEVLVRAEAGVAAQRLRLTAATPASVLLVDGDFFRDSDARYRSALDSLQVTYDTWELGLFNNSPALPPLATLAAYPAVIWFTGYDWRPNGNLNLNGQRQLARYLDGGGRLLFSSEDFLMSYGATPYLEDRLFRQDYLGVAEYHQDEGAAHQGPLVGAPESVLDGLTGCRLPPLGRDDDVSDQLVPLAGAQPALVDALGGVVATQLAAREHKSLFLAFDAGGLDPDCGQQLVARALDWFSPLTASRLTVLPEGRRTFSSGETVRLRLSLVNRGPLATRGIQARWQLPAGVTLDPADVPPGWTWEPTTYQLRWEGDLDLDAGHDHELALQLADDLPEGAAMTSEVKLDDGLGLPLTRTATWRVNTADLASSSKSAPGDRVLEVGELASFVVAVVNSGNRPTDGFVVTDTLPAGLVLVPASVAPSAGSQVDLTAVPNGIVWRGAVAAGRTASLSYSARVTTYNGGTLRNTAVLDDGHGNRLKLSAQVFARPHIMLPVTLRQVDEDP